MPPGPTPKKKLKKIRPKPKILGPPVPSSAGSPFPPGVGNSQPAGSGVTSPYGTGTGGGTSGPTAPYDPGGAAVTGVEDPSFDLFNLGEIGDLDIIVGGTLRPLTDEEFQSQGGGPGKWQLTKSNIRTEMDAFKVMAVGDQDGYAQIVAGLVRAGYLNPDDARYSAYTQSIGAAYLAALQDVYDANWGAYTANQEGILTPFKSVLEILDDQGNEVDKDGDGLPDTLAGAGQAPKQIVNRFTDEAALQSAVQQQAHSLLGRKLNPDEVGQFVSIFRGLETEFNAAANSDAPEVSITDPNPTGQAEQFVQSGFQGEIENKYKGEYVSQLQSMLGI